MQNILDDLSTLSTIPYTALEQLKDKVEDIIAYGVFESTKNLEECAHIDIGIGILVVKIEENKVYYKFRPSKTLESRIKSSVNKGVPTLIGRIEDSLSNKITKTYKDLF